MKQLDRRPDAPEMDSPLENPAQSPDGPQQNETLVAFVRRRWGDYLIRYLGRRVRTRADAHDLAQETYARLLRSGRQFEEIHDVRAYITTVAANALDDFMQRQRQAEGYARQFGEEDRPAQAELAHQVWIQELRQRVNDALLELSPKCRAVLVLYRVHGQKRPQIARHLGISVDMVKKYLAVGIKHLQDRLSDPSFK